MNNVVIFAGLPFDTAARNFQSWLLGRYEVKSIRILVSQLTSRSTGQVEVAFASVNDAMRAKQTIPGEKYLGHSLTVVA